jgi:integrase
MIAYHTGMRRGEIFSLLWDDVDINRATITVHADNTKTSQTRNIPMNDLLVDILEKWASQCPNKEAYVFPGKQGERLNNIDNSWDGMRKKCGLKGIRLKDLRSDFGSRLANNGVDLAVTQRLLGHSSPVVTMRYYVSIQDQTMRDAVAASMI